VVRSGLGWVAGLVLGSMVRPAVPILAPCLCQRPVSYDVVAAILRGDPPAAPRTWEFHPITRPSCQRAGPTRRRCQITDVDAYINASVLPSFSQPDFVLLHPPSGAWTSRGHAARRGRGVSYFPLPCHPTFRPHFETSTPSPLAPSAGRPRPSRRVRHPSPSLLALPGAGASPSSPPALWSPFLPARGRQRCTALR